MSEWKKVKFLDFIVLQRGFDLTKDSIKDGPYPVVCSTSIMGYHNNYKVEGPGVVTGRSGTLGETQYVKDNFWPHNTTLFVKDFKGNNRQFVYYFLKNFDIASMGGGAAIPSLNRNVLSNLSVTIPDLSIQNNIATILSRYDSLIENYQKQIKLLEEAAQRLYKEWFVNLRFPGHESTKIVDGVPEGWEKKNLGSIIDYEIGGGWGDETKVTPDHVTAFVIRGTDMNNLENGNLQGLPLRYHQSGNFIARQLQEYDIVFEVSGGSKTEGVAKTFLVLDQFLSQLDYPVICASFCKLIRLKKKEDACYVYDTLKEWRDSGITSQYDKRSASSIVNYRWKDFLSQQDIFVPSEDVLSRYTIISKKNHFMRVDLASQIRFLTEARDRLLPKLMSGEIAV